MDNPLKMDYLGVPLFQETCICKCKALFNATKCCARHSKGGAGQYVRRDRRWGALWLAWVLEDHLLQNKDAAIVWRWYRFGLCFSIFGLTLMQMLGSWSAVVDSVSFFFLPIIVDETIELKIGTSWFWVDYEKARTFWLVSVWASVRQSPGKLR